MAAANVVSHWSDDWVSGYVPPKVPHWQWVLKNGIWRGFSTSHYDSLNPFWVVARR